MDFNLKPIKESQKKIEYFSKTNQWKYRISTLVIAKVEKGKSVRSRNILQQSYKTALEFIQIKRMQW